MQLSDSERAIIGRTIGGEVDFRFGSPQQQAQEIGNILESIATRSWSRGKDWVDIALEPKQYSTWNNVKGQKIGLGNYNQYRQFIDKAINDYISGDLQPTKRGITHYHADYVSPNWASSMSSIGKVNKHEFYQDPRELQRGLVRVNQSALSKLGFDPGIIDGLMGPNTRKAMQNFQRSSGINITNTLDKTTMGTLAQAFEGEYPETENIDAPSVITAQRDQFSAPSNKQFGSELAGEFDIADLHGNIPSLGGHGELANLQESYNNLDKPFHGGDSSNINRPQTALRDTPSVMDFNEPRSFSRTSVSAPRTSPTYDVPSVMDFSEPRSYASSPSPSPSPSGSIYDFGGIPAFGVPDVSFESFTNPPSPPTSRPSPVVSTPPSLPTPRPVRNRPPSVAKIVTRGLIGGLIGGVPGAVTAAVVPSLVSKFKQSGGFRGIAGNMEDPIVSAADKSYNPDGSFNLDRFYGSVSKAGTNYNENRIAYEALKRTAPQRGTQSYYSSSIGALRSSTGGSNEGQGTRSSGFGGGGISNRQERDEEERTRGRGTSRESSAGRSGWR